MNMSLSPNGTKVKETIDVNYANSKRATSIKWIIINFVLFLLFAYDLWSCTSRDWSVRVACVCGAAAFTANMIVHATRLRPARRTAIAAASPPPPRAIDVTPSPSRASSVASLSPPRAWRTPPPDASPPPSPPAPITPHAPTLDQFIADRRSLDKYLRHHSARSDATREAWSPPQTSPPQQTTLQHYHLSIIDNGHTTQGSAHEEGASGGVSPRTWRRVTLSPRRLTEWTMNLRLWLHVTIVEPLARELQRVGDASVPPALAPYIEPYADRAYVTRRIRELSAGGCLSAYKWDGGGAEWDETKPTDAELVLHMFATYMDGQLPRASHKDRPFSAAHLCSIAHAHTHTVCIQQVTSRPPHYALHTERDQCVQVSRGHNNMLHTVLMFIATVAPQLHRVHLGPTGLNILWVIDR